ncbi:UPF0488 protein C8orf33-like [Tropilaelaps mercedesae]|uniref:UPF0488 protein C8orf33-like n=1 Tax=Tropilaelaps mercedesae TaxID=418985 RepID=A0A1V9X9J0_9ACAR|nr:UPF0488 protein C8orf33-like [Tropilaelaps mercedesae]
MDGSALDEQDQFEKEVAWCITALRKTLRKAQPPRHELQKALKVLPILEGSTAPMAKKRMAMRHALGDYRYKMAAENKALAKQLLNGTHRFAEFDGKARPPSGARALHIHKSPTYPPAPPPSVTSSPVKSAKSSMSSTPSPLKGVSGSPAAGLRSPSADSRSSVSPTVGENLPPNASTFVGQPFAFDFEIDRADRRER